MLVNTMFIKAAKLSIGLSLSHPDHLQSRLIAYHVGIAVYT